jgi:hypothetical protein
MDSRPFNLTVRLSGHSNSSLIRWKLAQTEASLSGWILNKSELRG